MVFSKLDRAFCNDQFLDLWTQVNCLPLHRLCSDHHPLLLDCVATLSHPSRPFRFMEMWTRHDSFLSFVKESWSDQIHGHPSFILCHKLKLLRGRLKKWNWEVFGDLNHKILDTSLKVEEVQKELSEFGVSEASLSQEMSLSSDLSNFLLQKEIMLKE